MKIIVYGFTEAAKNSMFKSGLDSRGSSYWSDDDASKSKRKARKLTFPCEMLVTDEHDLNHHAILEDSFGNKWLSSHFYTKPRT